MADTEQIQLFMSLFRGRTDVYARYWEKNGRSGYSPAYEFNWNEFMAFKAKGGKLSDFPNKKLLLLTVETIENHLSGRQTIGIYPLLKDNTSYFIAADFDGENWKEDTKAFLKACKKYKIPTYIERSKSGKGCHAWIFFEDRYPAYKSRKLILVLIQHALNFSQFEKEISFDRLFPNQDYHSNQGFGNLIALPFQKAALESENTLFLDQETLINIPGQWKFLETIEKLITLTGDDSITKRRLKTDQIKTGNFQIIIATGQLFGEGIDIATANCLFLVYPFSFEGKLAQYIGRIKRTEEKQIVYDYHDKQVGFFDRLFQKRMKYYRKLKAQIINI